MTTRSDSKHDALRSLNAESLRHVLGGGDPDAPAGGKTESLHPGNDTLHRGTVRSLNPDALESVTGGGDPDSPDTGRREGDPDIPVNG